MDWRSRGREVISPEMMAVDLSVNKGVICFTEGFYPRLVKGLDLSDSERAPHISGFQKGRVGADLVLYKSEVGAPAAAMGLEVMIASGVRRVMMLGVAGSLVRSCPIGSVVLPTWGVREEGTSYHYLPSGTRPRPSAKFTEELRAGLCELDPISGGVWSTDAPYRETFAKVRKYARRGVLAVDMESTAMMAVAMRRKVRFAAALTISDMVCGSEWGPAFGTRVFNRARNMVCEKAAEVIMR